jgi:DNA-binding MarR family transcriptional regulator
MPEKLDALGRAVKQLQYRHHRALDSRLAEVGTTLAQWDALRAIDRLPGSAGHALALATFQSDQAFGALCNRLAAQGLLERRPGFGRRIEHYLTAAGKAMLAAGQPIMREVLAMSFATLSDEERMTLLGLLQRVIDDHGADFVSSGSLEAV